jgi:hypothetical protein
MVADIRGVPNRYVLELGGVDCSDQTTSAALGKASRSAQTFSEYRTGGPFALKIAATQNFATGSIWDLAVNHPGSAVTGAFYPLGNSRPAAEVFASRPPSLRPTSDAHVGGEGGAVDADSPTFDTEWLLTGTWAQSTVS